MPSIQPFLPLRRAAIAGAVLALSAGFLLGCGSNDGPDATVPLPDAESFRTDIVATLRSVRTVHFTISHREGGTNLGGGLLLKNAEGDVLVPDRARLLADTTLAEFGLSLEVGIIQIATETYLRDPISSRWRTVDPGSLPFNFIDMHNSLADALASTTGLSIAPGPRIGGEQTFLLSGSVLPQAFRGLVPSAQGDEPLSLEVFVGGNDLLPRSVTLSGRLIGDDPLEMVRSLGLSRYDEPVTIEPPI